MIEELAGVIAMRSPHTRRSELICRIDMTAFLSIQLALLFMFIAAVRIQPDLPGWGANLPKVAHSVPMPGANREDAIAVAIERDGAVYLGHDSLSLDRLRSGISDAVSHGAERKVYIRADARASYGSVVKVLATIRSAGIENIAFLAYERQRPTAPSPTVLGGPKSVLK